MILCYTFQEGKRRQFQELTQLMRELLDRRRQILSRTLPRVSVISVSLIYLYYVQWKIFFRQSFSRVVARILGKGVLEYVCKARTQNFKPHLFINCYGWSSKCCRERKFRWFTVGQNCSVMCTNKGGHRVAFLNERPAEQATTVCLLVLFHAYE